MEVEMLQDVWFEGMNAMVRYAFNAAEMMWEQTKRTLGAVLEQGGKLQGELQKSVNEWMDSVDRGEAEFRRATERGLESLKSSVAAMAEGNGHGWAFLPTYSPYLLPTQMLKQWNAAFAAPAAEEKASGKAKQGQ